MRNFTLILGLGFVGLFIAFIYKYAMGVVIHSQFLHLGVMLLSFALAGACLTVYFKKENK